MSSQKESNKLSDDEKFELTEFYKDNKELWVTNQEITRSQRALKEELTEDFENNFSTEIIKKVFHGSRASFLWEYKKYQQDEKLPKKPWNF